MKLRPISSTRWNPITKSVLTENLYQNLAARDISIPLLYETKKAKTVLLRRMYFFFKI